jgi:putative tryptophan/tyrosine transport system substrate-binding protein
LVTKRLRLLHDLVPKAVRVAVLLNPANAAIAESALRAMQEAAPTIGLEIQILNATTIGQIDAAFATLARERPDALFVASDAFFTSRRGQFATLTARERLPAAYPNREYVVAGGLMSYGTDLAEMYHHVGIYTGNILKGRSPPTSRSRSRPSSSSSSTCRPRKRSASSCRPDCSPLPTR